MIVFRLFVAFVLISVSASQEGSMIKLSSDGLNYIAGSIASNLMSSQLTAIRFANYSGTSGLLAYNVKNITLVKFPSPKVALKANDVDGLSVLANSSNSEIHFNWDYQLGTGWLKIKDSGSGVFVVGSISLNLGISLNIDPTGSPKISITSCRTIIDSVTIKINNKLTAFYTLLSSLYTDKIKLQMQQTLCEKAKTIEEAASNNMVNISLAATLGDGILLDMRPLATPTFKSGYMDTFCVGQFYSNLTARPAFNVASSHLPDETSSPTKMIRIQVTSTMLNSAANTIFNQGNMTYNQNISLGEISVVFGVSAEFPINVNFSALKAPTVNIGSSSVSLTTSNQLVINGYVDSNTVKNIIIADLELTLEIRISLESGLIKGVLVNMGKKVTIVKNNLLNFADADLVETLTSFLEGATPDINDKLGLGFALPAFNNYNLVDPILKQETSYYTFDADLSPSVNEVIARTAISSNSGGAAITTATDAANVSPTTTVKTAAANISATTTTTTTTTSIPPPAARR